MPRRPRRPASPRPRAIHPARAAGLFALALLVAIASIASGAHYVFCVPMQRVELRPCCPGHHRARVVDAVDASDDGDSCPADVSADECCQHRRLPTFPSTRGAHRGDVAVLPAPLVALLPLEFLYFGEGAPDARRERAVLEQPRAGPEPPLFALHRSYLN